VRGLFVGDGTRVREDLAPPVPATGEVRVRLRLAGVCATDLALARGYMGYRGVPGHEFVGEALDGEHAGRRVVGEINAGCGTCDRCRSGDPRHCSTRSVLGILGRQGAFAEELVLPASNLLPVPDDVPDETAVFCEPLAAALEIESQVELRPGESALVVGDGRLGLLCAHVLARAGLEVTVAGRHPERAELLPAGVRHRTGLFEQDASEPGRPRFDLAVEVTGNPRVLQRVLACVRPRGTLVLKTTSEDRVPLDLAPIVIDELTLVGSRCGRFEPALELLRAGTIPVERWIHGRYPLSRADEALAHAGRPGTLKILIENDAV